MEMILRREVSEKRARSSACVTYDAGNGLNLAEKWGGIKWNLRCEGADCRVCDHAQRGRD
jgi:hypothetical protein